MRFVRAVQAEIGKLRTVVSTYILIGIGFFLTIGLGLLVAYAPGQRRGNATGSLGPLHGTAKWFLRPMALFGSVSLPFALAIGVLILTGEFRHKTITSTFLSEPKRTLVIGSKLAVSLLAGLSVGICSAAGALALGFILVLGSSGTVSTMLGQYEQLMGILLAAALYALYGTALGALLKNQVAALVTGLGIDLIVLPILAGVVPGAARWFPEDAAMSLVSAVQRTGFTNNNVHLLPWWGGVLILLAWGAALAGIGAATTIRKDVT